MDARYGVFTEVSQFDSTLDETFGNSFDSPSFFMRIFHHAN